MALKLGSLWLSVWGILNLFGGLTAGRQHPSGWVMPAFVLLGILISAGGVGFWLRKTWSVVISLVALIGLSVAALLSGYALRETAGMNWSHHIVRAAISSIGFVVAFTGLRSASDPHDPRSSRLTSA